ncbi:hypothetical protein BJY16_003762 [Actinoplanes octamycinicus]|uniref:Uncharacterized protein n=1 Tax=Actinoplanes octamycinicus TaxID=135948 RepID=A0A7W7GXW1_9ACTN|nr:hypothetical protein [Actinoplanes octamycinicus]MBB4740303.1 hypothetical protein [Actinoplanes octamycinicus]GIE62621.1 hypothetical protein Aoc01nite_80230 [Actinoplanes octamycinicus]
MIITGPFREVMVTWFVGQSLVFLALAFLLGLVTGRLTASRDDKRFLPGKPPESPIPAGNATTGNDRSEPVAHPAPVPRRRPSPRPTPADTGPETTR